MCNIKFRFISMFQLNLFHMQVEARFTLISGGYNSKSPSWPETLSRFHILPPPLCLWVWHLCPKGFWKHSTTKRKQWDRCGFRGRWQWSNRCLCHGNSEIYCLYCSELWCMSNLDGMKVIVLYLFIYNRFKDLFVKWLDCYDNYHHNLKVTS